MKILYHLIDRYIFHWSDFIDYEEYKWKAVKHFQQHFNDASKDVSLWISTLFAENSNLLIAPMYFPLGMLLDVAKARPVEMKGMLLALYDESVDVKDRIKRFVNIFEENVKELTKEGYRNWDETTQTYQDAHAISVYMSLKCPNKYYIYKWSIFRDFAKMIGYKRLAKKPFEKMYEFNNMCDSIKKELLSQLDFIESYKAWLNRNDYSNPYFIILTQDFIYTIVRHHNPDAFGKKEKNKPLARLVGEISSSEYVFKLKTLKHTFKPSKINFEKKDKLSRSLGVNGELWAVNYEKERLKNLGIKFEVEYTARDIGDGVGYDIKSVEDDGVTPRFIEVKTTMGHVDTPFYYTSNEMAFSTRNSSHYYVYRIYNFSSPKNQADVLIIRGSLKKLNGEPVSFKVSVYNE